uniref:Putative secreted protein n=1 Tax=Amblyomma triste TaxID=251400 RepID=A0A023G4H8_AMBTT
MTKTPAYYKKGTVLLMLLCIFFPVSFLCWIRSRSSTIFETTLTGMRPKQPQILWMMQLGNNKVSKCKSQQSQSERPPRGILQAKEKADGRKSNKLPPTGLSTLRVCMYTGAAAEARRILIWTF